MGELVVFILEFTVNSVQLSVELRPQSVALPSKYDNSRARFRGSLAHSLTCLTFH